MTDSKWEKVKREFLERTMSKPSDPIHQVSDEEKEKLAKLRQQIREMLKKEIV